MTIYRHEASGPIVAGDLWNVTMHSQGSVSLQVAQDAWASAVGSIAAAFAPFWADTTSVTTTETFQLDPNTGKNVGVASAATTHAGSQPTGQLPPSITVTVGLRTATPTRGGRGRMFWPGFDAANLQGDGLWVPAACGTIATAVANALRGMQPTTVPSIYHRATRLATAINQVTVGVIPNVQRRRVNKVLQNYQRAAV